VTLSNNLAQATTLLGNPANVATSIQSSKDSLEAARAKLETAWDALDTGTVRTEANATAAKDFAPA
jgi:hypothetical protein